MELSALTAQDVKLEPAWRRARSLREPHVFASVPRAGRLGLYTPFSVSLALHVSVYELSLRCLVAVDGGTLASSEPFAMHTYYPL